MKLLLAISFYAIAHAQDRRHAEAMCKNVQRYGKEKCHPHYWLPVCKFYGMCKRWNVRTRARDANICACYDGKKMEKDRFGKCMRCVDPDEFENLDTQLI